MFSRNNDAENMPVSLFWGRPKAAPLVFADYFRRRVPALLMTVWVPSVITQRYI